jgi:hypothetical protein
MTTETQSESTSIRTLLADLATGVSTLVRQELRLAQAEGAEKVTRLTLAIAAIVGGLLVANCALLVLLQALVLKLSDYMPAGVAALIVGIAVAIVAFVLIHQGQKALTAENLTPQRTLRSLDSDKDMVMGKVQ